MITSQLEILNQGKSYLAAIDDNQYVEVKAPLFSSSVGTHIRHIVDHYQALMERKNHVVNYNKRQRFSKIETCRLTALVAIDAIIEWLTDLSEHHLTESVSVISEIALSEEVDSLTGSTLARELVFVSSHAVHHYSIIKVISGLQNVRLPDTFGIAPATASFLRQQQAS